MGLQEKLHSLAIPLGMLRCCSNTCNPSLRIVTSQNKNISDVGSNCVMKLSKPCKQCGAASHAGKHVGTLLNSMIFCALWFAMQLLPKYDHQTNTANTKSLLQLPYQCSRMHEANALNWLSKILIILGRCMGVWRLLKKASDKSLHACMP